MIVTTTFDNAKIERLKDLIDRRWALAKAARQHAPRYAGFMTFSDMMAADDTVQPEQDEIRNQAAAIAESLRGCDEMIDYYYEVEERYGHRYGNALDHLWHGTHGWIV